MGKSLAEYAKQHPQQMPEQAIAPTTGETLQERQQELEQAAQLKASILRQIEQGNAPQSILYTAIKCIALLTNDKEFAAAGETGLDKIYADIAQQSFLIDNAAVEAEKLKAQQAAYHEKTRAAIRRQIKGNEKITRALYAVLDAIEETTPENAESAQK